jgi:hypothetical protein
MMNTQGNDVQDNSDMNQQERERVIELLLS